MYILFQNIWSNLKKEPLVSLLFILQIAITAFIIFSTSFEYKYSVNQLEMVNTAYSDYTYYFFTPEIGSYENRGEWYTAQNTTGFPIRFNNAIEQIRNVEGVNLVVNNDSISFVVLDPCLHFEEKDRNGPLALLRDANNDLSNWKSCYIDKNFFETYPMRLDSGRFFTDEEFELTYEKGSVTPVILGYEFKKYFDIGDVLYAWVNQNIRDEDSYQKIEIIGFVAEDSTYINKNGSTLYTYNDKIIIPYNYRQYDEYPDMYNTSGGIVSNGMFANGYQGMYILVEKENEKEIMEQLNQILVDNDIAEKITFTKYLVSSVAITNNYKDNMNIRMALTYITVLFSFVSIVLVTVNRISSNIRNYAIHLISGATYGNIYFYIIGEIALYSLLGFIVGSNAYGIRNIITNYINNFPIESQFGFKYGWMICLAMLVLFTLICFFIVVGRMRKIDLSSVLRDKVYADGGRGTVYKVVTVSAFAVISVCIIFAVSYFVHINSVDMYYRHFYTENTKKVTVFNDPSLGENVTITPQYKELGTDYVLDKFVTINYTDSAPYIRGTYYEGDVALPDIISGRYFDEEEMYGGKRRKVVVMGKKAYEDFATVREDGTAYYTYLNTDYEVIGIAGKPDGTETRLDEWVFMPLDTVLEKYGKTGTYFIDGTTKKNIAEVNEVFLASLENEALTESVDQTLTEVVIGPTDALVSLAIMIAINIIIVCIYYTDKKHYTVAVKKFIGYSKGMVFGDIFAGFLRWASVGYGIGVAIIITILLTPLKDFIMFKTLSLNIPTILISFIATALLALIFAAIAINRTYNRDTSEVLRG